MYNYNKNNKKMFNVVNRDTEDPTSVLTEKKEDIDITTDGSPMVSSVRFGTPKTQRRVLDHEFKMQEEQQRNIWESMCLRVDRRAVQYFCQIIIITSIMIFAGYQLIHLQECDQQQSYLGLLTLLIGLVLPNPKFNPQQPDIN